MTTRNQSLDVLRGVAMIVVIVDHYQYINRVQNPSIIDFCIAGPSAMVSSLGVDLFFVLSGFLISGLLFEELASTGELRVIRFLARRGLKIYPGFYVFIGLTALFNPAMLHSRKMLSELLFLQSYLPRIWGHTWSLAVEEHFYLALPLLFLLLNLKRKLDWIPAISIVLIIVCLALRVLTSFTSGDGERIMRESHLRADSLFAGVALSYFYHFRRDEFLRASTWPLGLLGFVLTLPSSLSFSTGGQLRSLYFSFNLAGCTLILLWAVPRVLRFPLLAEVGRYSYSIYLWHLLVTAFFRQLPATPLFFAADVLMCLAVGTTMGVLVEQPILSFRDRVLPGARYIIAERSSTVLDVRDEPRGQVCSGLQKALEIKVAE